MSADFPKFTYTGDDARYDQDQSDMTNHLFELIHGEFIPKIREAARNGFSQVIIPATVGHGVVHLGCTLTHIGDGIVTMTMPPKTYDWVVFVRMMRNQGFDVTEDYGRQVVISWNSL